MLDTDQELYMKEMLDSLVEKNQLLQLKYAQQGMEVRALLNIRRPCNTKG
jgi:hypothetical protein